MLVLDPNLLLPQLFFFVVRCSWQALQTALLLNPVVVDVAVLASITQVQHAEGVNEHSFFNLVVERGVGHETWRLVDFNQPGLCLLVKKDVDSKHLKTQLVLYVLWLSSLLDVRYLVVASDDSFNS